MRNHHTQQLGDDRCRDVRHNAQRKDGQLEKSATAEEVNQLIQPSRTARTGQTLLNVAVIHERCRNEGAQTEKTHHRERKEDFSAQVRRLEDSA